MNFNDLNYLAVRNKFERRKADQQTAQAMNPETLRIGKRDADTGKHTVVYPNGGKQIAGVPLYNASPSFDTAVKSGQPIGRNAISLEHKSNVPLEIPAVEEKKVSTLSTAMLLVIGAIQEDLFPGSEAFGGCQYTAGAAYFKLDDRPAVKLLDLPFVSSYSVNLPDIGQTSFLPTWRMNLAYTSPSIQVAQILYPSNVQLNSSGFQFALRFATFILQNGQITASFDQAAPGDPFGGLPADQQLALLRWQSQQVFTWRNFQLDLTESLSDLFPFLPAIGLNNQVGGGDAPYQDTVQRVIFSNNRLLQDLQSLSPIEGQGYSLATTATDLANYTTISEFLEVYLNLAESTQRVKGKISRPIYEGSPLPVLPVPGSTTPGDPMVAAKMAGIQIRK